MYGTNGTRWGGKVNEKGRDGKRESIGHSWKRGKCYHKE